MKINWQKEFDGRIRQGLGVLLIVLGVGYAGFYYYYRYNLTKNPLIVTHPAPSASVTAVDANASPDSTSASTNATGKIKLSTATLSDLESLPHIGETKAKAILDYRTKHGFKSVDDLQNVPGIGPKTMDDLRPLVEL